MTDESAEDYKEQLAQSLERNTESVKSAIENAKNVLNSMPQYLEIDSDDIRDPVWHEFYDD